MAFIFSPDFDVEWDPLRLVMTDVSGNPVRQQRKGPGVPEQVKDVEWPLQSAGHQHPDFFKKVWLREKRSKSKKQYQWNKKTVFQQKFHVPAS
jgi:hypothetical protein